MAHAPSEEEGEASNPEVVHGKPVVDGREGSRFTRSIEFQHRESSPYPTLALRALVDMGLPIEDVWLAREKEAEHRRRMQVDVLKLETGDRIDERRQERLATLVGAAVGGSALLTIILAMFVVPEHVPVMAGVLFGGGLLGLTTGFVAVQLKKKSRSDVLRDNEVADLRTSVERMRRELTEGRVTPPPRDDSQAG